MPELCNNDRVPRTSKRRTHSRSNNRCSARKLAPSHPSFSLSLRGGKGSRCWIRTSCCKSTFRFILERKGRKYHRKYPGFTCSCKI
jgi:formylglycine-generating enzyme required for sulfatase activity